jgi:hypothetical protein
MCMQCMTAAETIDQDFLPGYALMIAMENSAVGPEEWPKGHYGLVKINNPTFVFPPVPDPRSDEFLELYHQLSEQFFFPPEIGGALIAAAKQAGYEKGLLLLWLMERVFDKTAKGKRT